MNINLKHIREKRQWSIRKLAIISGVQHGYISELENGNKDNPSISVICKLCVALQVSPNDMIPEEYWK